MHTQIKTTQSILVDKKKITSRLSQIPNKYFIILCFSQNVRGQQITSAQYKLQTALQTVTADTQLKKPSLWLLCDTVVAPESLWKT